MTDPPDEQNSKGFTRRTFVKVATVGTVAAGGGIVMGVGGTIVDRMITASRRWEAWSRRRPEGEWVWLTVDEAGLLASLADVVIPRTSDGPSATDAGVVESLDRRFLASPNEGEQVSRALIAFNRLSYEVFGRPLPDLSPESRRRVFSIAEELYRVKVESSGIFEEALQKLGVVENMMEGVEPAADEFARFVRLIRDEFYASPQAWTWLGYEGPPFPSGYPDVGTRCADAVGLGSG